MKNTTAISYNNKTLITPLIAQDQLCEWANE